MKVGILCAGEKEVKPFLQMLEDRKVTEKALLKFYQGTINGIEVVTLFSGIGKVNSAFATQILIDTFKCDTIIDAGTSGGIDEKIDVFDTVVSTEVGYHDVGDELIMDINYPLTSRYFKADNHLLECALKTTKKIKTEYKVFFGRMVTGEKFIVDESRENLQKNHNPLSTDMESCAVSHVCYVNKIPFISIRTITDTFKHKGMSEFQKNCNKASSINAMFIKELLKELK